jgi:hypothetical protein
MRNKSAVNNSSVANIIWIASDNIIYSIEGEVSCGLTM